MTYPDPSMGKEGILPDCHWSSLNFFNYDAQPYLLDSRLATSAVLERFVAHRANLSDSATSCSSLTSNGDAFHSCVYLADDIVFSKNGRNVLSPWILTTTVTRIEKGLPLTTATGACRATATSSRPRSNQRTRR